eukprot:evm.model.NODE_11200_length_10544_cov_22.009010.1
MPRARPAKKAAKAEAPVPPAPAAEEEEATAPEGPAPEAPAKDEEGEATNSGSTVPENHTTTTTTGNNKKKAEAIEGSDVEEEPSNKRQKSQPQEEEAREEAVEAETAVKADTSPVPPISAGEEGQGAEEDPEKLMKSIIEKQLELQEAKEKAQKRLNEVRSSGVCRGVWLPLSVVAG